MLDKPITDIMRHVRLLVPDDRIARAASLIKGLGISELPVINFGKVVGVVREADLLPALVEGESGRQEPVSKVMKREPTLANRYMSVGQVADIFSRGKMAVLPVVDEFGGYVGIVTRSDVMALLGRVMRPQSVGGMATPLGVHLTTGTISAGPGSLGLFLTGASMALMMFVSSVIIFGLGWLLGKTTGIPVISMLESPAISTINVWDAAAYVAVPLMALLTLLQLRLSPLAGYHAAEHMVVHTMEQGEELVPEIVKQMPRVHPRCGTNLLAGAGIFLIITGWFSSAEAVLVAMMILLVGWRTVGGYLQYYGTTKRPNEKQVANGIKVGNELLEKYLENPHMQVTGLQRIWSIGLLQTASGLIAMVYLLRAVITLLGLPSMLIPGG